MKKISIGFCLVGLMLLLGGCESKEDEIPDAWKILVKAEGQVFPIPMAWISTPEGKIAHSLKLPIDVPAPVAFDFEKARGAWYWPASHKEVAISYFEHLCKTEAGEWTFKKIGEVEGLYFARPGRDIPDEFIEDVYGPEAPWVEKEFQWMGEDIRPRGMQFLKPPFSRIHFVEEPKQDVEWQRHLSKPYLRIFGFSDPHIASLGQAAPAINPSPPMRIIGLDQPTAKYAYTWRGITRPQDRRFGIAGSELIIYDRKSHEVISVSRNFKIAGDYAHKVYGREWRVSPVCVRGLDSNGWYMNGYVRKILLKE